MARSVDTGTRSIGEYRTLIGEERLAELRSLAAPLSGARVMHLNATAYGGGVAEILQTLVPLMRGLGLDAEWCVLEGSDDFFELTKKLHNGLQGMPIEFPETLRDLYLTTLDRNRNIFASDWDYVVVHDPQPAGMLGLLDGRRTGSWCWRCHIDTSTPFDAAVEFLTPYLPTYDVAIFTLPDYVAPGMNLKQIEFIYPSIDPLSPKNQPLARVSAREILAKRFDIDAGRPLVTQVSRFDPWKDPLGVIDAYREVKRSVPEVQLALVGNLADDDPEGTQYHARTVAHAADDPDIHVLSTLDRLSRDALTHALEINAFQSGSDVVVQKSTREGFGLVVAEAMWKGTAVIGGSAGGIVHQIEDGVSGYLVSSIDECADRMTALLADPETRRELGARGRESVRERFLITRHLADYLRLFRSLAG